MRTREEELHPRRHLLAAAAAELDRLASSLGQTAFKITLLDEEGRELYRVGTAPNDVLVHAADIRGADEVRVGTVEIHTAATESALVRALGEQLARNIKSEIAVRQSSRHSELLRALELLADAALSHVEVQVLLNDVLVRLREMFHVDTAAILLTSDSGQELHMKAALGLEREIAEQVVIPLARGVAGRIAGSRTPVIIDDLSRVDVFSPLLRQRVTSLLGASLVIEGRIIGVVHVGSAHPRHFTDSEAKQLQIMADRLALAIDHARLSRSERAARSEAERAERRYRDLLQNIDAIVWEADAKTWAFTFVSRRAEKMLGYPIKDWLQRENFWISIIHPDDRDRILARRKKAVEQGRGASLEYRVLAADGRTVWVRVLFDIVRDEAGVPRQLRGLMLDITQRREAEEAALRLAAIVAGSDDAIIGKNLEGIITSWNPGAVKMYGYEPEEVVGRHISLLSPPELRSDIDEIMRKLRVGERLTHYETHRVRKDGEIIDVSLTISPIRNPEGTIIGASTIARDVTEVKRAERTLRMTEKLAATGRLAASIAHEINNPMASVTNLLYLLEHHGNLDDTAREYVRLAEEELGRVTHIVRQMLGFYREAESPVDVSLREVVENVLLLYKRRISNTGIHVQSRYDFDGVIHAFPGEIRQVFSNLIVNAVEAVGSTGCIRVHVSASRDWARPEARGVRVTIADNGPGIAPAARRKIFDPFFTTKGERGTGLGLWVSEGIVRKHGGFIRVHTSTGRYHGTSFSVFIPTQAPAQKRARTPRVA